MSDFGWYFTLIAAFIAGAVFLVFAFARLNQKRLVENIPTSKVQSIAMGLVEIYGTVVPIEKLKSPFTGKDCVYYRYTIEESKGSGKRARWVTIVSGLESKPFNLEDDTGQVLVEGEWAEVDIPADVAYDSSFGRDPPEQIQKFLKAKNLSFESFLGMNRTMRYTEYHIAPGDKLYVMGTAESRAGTSTKNEGAVVIRAGNNKGLFYICDKPEKEVLKRLLTKALTGMAVGAVLVVVSAIMLLDLIRTW